MPVVPKGSLGIYDLDVTDLFVCEATESKSITLFSPFTTWWWVPWKVIHTYTRGLCQPLSQGTPRPLELGFFWLFETVYTIFHSFFFLLEETHLSSHGQKIWPLGSACFTWSLHVTTAFWSMTTRPCSSCQYFRQGHGALNTLWDYVPRTSTPK